MYIEKIFKNIRGRLRVLAKSGQLVSGYSENFIDFSFLNWFNPDYAVGIFHIKKPVFSSNTAKKVLLRNS